MRVAIVVAQFNDFVTGPLLAGARRALAAAGVPESAVTVLHVPGAFEIPLAAKRAGASGQFDAVVCLGCLIKGATVHFEYIAEACAHGITQASLDTGIPMSFGVLTVLSAEQAIERAADDTTNKGYEAAMAALEMAALLKRLDAAGQGA